MVEKEVESCYIEIKTKSGKKIIMGSLYRSPNTKETELINHVQNTIVKCMSAKQEVDFILGMDHNLDLLKLNNHKGTRLFYNKMVELELVPSITRPTRITNHSATLIDNIFVRGSLQKDFHSSIIISDISDHLPSIFLAKQTKVRNNDHIEFESRCLSETKISRIKKALDEVDWHGTLNSDSCSNNFDMLMRMINAIMDQEAPVRTIRHSGKRRFVEPWITTGLDNSARTVRKLYKSALQSDANLEAWKKYRSYRNRYNRTKRLMMVNYYKSKCEEYKTNTKRLWEVLNRVIGKSKNTGLSISHLTVNGIKIFDKRAIANEFGRFYANMGKDLAGKISTGNIENQDYLMKIERNPKSILLNYTTQEEIRRVIEGLPNKTSSGWDGISNILLKKLSSSLLCPLNIIFNQSIHKGEFPAQMKKAEIIPLYKGKELDYVINYRPVSLLITISKVLEKIIYLRTSSFLEKHCIFYSSQYGFRANHSCEHAVMEMVGRVIQAQEENLYSMGIYLDLSKAFDTLDHKLLLQKLERYGIRGTAHDWYRSYLHGRSLVTKINEDKGRGKLVKSNSFDIEFGTVQGSCLGPLLFLVFVNDIQLLNLYSSLILFADDMNLISSHRNRRFLYYQMLHDMEILITWFKYNKLSLNLGKSVLMKFWEDTTNDENFAINGMVIPEVTNTKFLGTFIDNELNWNIHVNQLYNKIKANQFFIK